jgi:hypothetical protein
MLAPRNLLTIAAAVQEAVVLDKRQHFEAIGLNARRQKTGHAVDHNCVPADDTAARLWLSSWQAADEFEQLAGLKNVIVDAVG